MGYDFSEQTVVVTGGTRGIGAAISRAFLAAGARVHALYARSDAHAEAFSASVDRPGALGTARVDVTDPAAVETFFDGLEGGLHVLVNNAGIRKDAVLGAMPDEAWRDVLSTNLDGTFNCAKQAVRLMSRARYGRIVNIISPSGRLGLAGQANYAASKAGQEALSKSLAKEVAKRKVTVNCVSPGFVDTELLADIDDDHKKALLDTVPLRRFGAPEEIAAAVLFLASADAAYITGTTLEVSGGL